MHYIKREPLKARIEASPFFSNFGEDGYFIKGFVVELVEMQPTADVVEVRHGEWREVNDKYPRYVCTVCNHLFNNKNYNYCPCCGAKMDGERSENGK